MPTLLFKAVRSFSSEDPSFPATNLLASTTSTGKKWKCQSPGEKSLEIVLELASPSTITAIDIGNEHSAFVEVWVSKNGAPEFQQILQISSFMSPVESRNSDPVNRVRCFSKSALVEQVVESKTKWELVKIICTQPFNKQVQYGLSFVKVHSTDVKDSNNDTAGVATVTQKLFGQFKIREDSPDSDNESPQSLFARWKGSRNGTSDGKGIAQPSVPLSAAAAIRNASLKNQSPQVNRATVTPKRADNRHSMSNEPDDDDTIDKKKNRNRSELMYEDEDDKPNEKLDKIILKDRERLDRERSDRRNSEKKVNRNGSTDRKQSKDSVDKGTKTASSPAQTKMSRNDAGKPSTSKDASPAAKKTKRQSSPIPVPPVKKMKASKERTYKPFNKLLEGVVLVISGIQNPARATIRQQALDMGAKYKPDWEPSCTHLICAFKNTPKYNQVQGHGKIIIKDWITECHKRKMRIPWRRFALNSDDGKESESENEILCKTLQPTTETKPSTKNKSSSPSKSSKSPSKAKSTFVLSDDDMASDNDSLHRYNLNSSQTERNQFVSSGSDTEDEIRRVLDKKPTATVTIDTDAKSSDDIYSASTEEDEGGSRRLEMKSESVAPLPELFKGKQFYLSQNISSTDEIKLKRFISVYGGDITLVANQSDYILSNKPKETPSDYKGEVVKPLWIFECNELETLLPTKRYNFSDW